MSTLTIPNTFVDGGTVLASEHNANNNAIATVVNGNIDATNLADSAVTTAKIASSAVTTAKIADSNVTKAKIEDAQQLPAGMLAPYAGSSAPTGWLLCYGQAVSRSTYADLFSAIGTTYGAGDGSTTFGLPDLRGRVAAGKDNMGGSDAGRLSGATSITGTTLGSAGGAATHTLSEAELATHAHTFVVAGALGAEANSLAATGGTAPGGAGVTVTTTSSGSGSAHNNTQPTIVLNYIIKT
jgi:microcystin-dependent protein